MKVLFIAEAEREYPSTICMATEPVEYLCKSGIDARFLRGCEVAESDFDGLDVVVFVKYCRMDFLRKAHERKIKTVWHSDESLMIESENMLANKECLDAIISTCTSYTKLCRKLGFTSQHIKRIYHHHCNFSNEITDFKDEVENVGFIGMDDQFHYRDEFEEFLKGHGCKLVADQTASAYKENLFDTLRSLDLGIIFIDENYTQGVAGGLEQSWGDRINYRSNTKIVNFISFGIPAVTVPYNSYVDVLNNKPKCCLWADTFEQACSGLDLLIRNKPLRKKIRDNCLKHRDDFHLSSITKDFIDLFKYLL